MKGGALLGNQLYQFFMANKFNDDTLLPDNFVPLNKNNKKLYNDYVNVYINPKNLHIVSVHKGTDFKKINDIFNNVRNLFSVKNETFITKRNIISRDVHIYLSKYIEELLKNNKPYNLLFKKYANKIKNETVLKLTNKEIVEQILKNKLTTIGSSQGAIYAYINGIQGRETITLNPAPYISYKPENVYDIKIKGDIVSIFSGIGDDKNIKRHSRRVKVKTKGIISKHLSKTLKNNNMIFGDKMLFSKPNNYNLNKIRNDNSKYITVSSELDKDEKILSEVVIPSNK